jgi:hypothetical protein
MNFKAIHQLGLLACVGSLLLASTASARGFALPLGLEWCQERSAAEAKMDAPREAADDVVESAERIWRIDGLLSAIFEQGKLVKISVRSYETESHLSRTRSALEKMLGKGTAVGKKTRWSPGGKGSVEMKVQTEQIYAIFEAPAGLCGGPAVAKTGLSDREQADVDAMKRKQAVEWDPYAEDDEEEAPIVKRKKKEEKKEEQQKEEEEEEPEDEDIDW